MTIRELKDELEKIARGSGTVIIEDYPIPVVMKYRDNGKDVIHPVVGTETTYRYSTEKDYLDAYNVYYHSLPDMTNVDIEIIPLSHIIIKEYSEEGSKLLAAMDSQNNLFMKIGRANETVRELMRQIKNLIDNLVKEKTYRETLRKWERAAKAKVRKIAERMMKNGFGSN